MWKVGSMIRVYLQQRRLLLSAVFAAGMMIAVSGAVPVWAGNKPAKVEFDCKIISTSRVPSLWVVELRRRTGEPARIVSGLEGSTFHLKDLKPGIYTVCIIGTENRRSCESVDLTPPPNKRSYRFKKSYEAPDHILNVGTLNTVSARRLGVPEDARAELYRAIESQLHGNSKEAERHLEKALQIDPNYSDALNNLGTYYHRKGDNEKAISCFEKVTTLDPGFYGGWVNLAGSLLTMGKFHQALPAITRAYSMRPDDTQVVSQMALTYFYLHDLDNARKFFQKVVAMDPSSPMEPQLYLVHIALAQRNKEEASDYIRQFLSLHPNAPKAKELKDTLARMDTIRFSPPPEADQSKQ
jgi:Flp pilus assembly protein TadD